MKISNIINTLKDNDQDFEFYPTTDEMLRCIYNDIDVKNQSILDIGCGQAKIAKLFKEWSNDSRYTQSYYVIEKSIILLNQLPSDVIIVGTDFHDTTLIDKSVDIIFCNPPYSEYVEWTCKIIKEGFCKVAYLVIPERWSENKVIQDSLKQRDIKTEIIYTGDFLNAERQARAKINIVKLVYKKVKENQYRDTYIKEDPFDGWFNEFFNVKVTINNEFETEWGKEQRLIKEKEDNRVKCIRNGLQNSESIDEVLVRLYQEEQNKMINSYKALSELDYDILKELNVDILQLKEGLKLKIENLKNLYWKELFNRLDKITNRFTSKTRQAFLDTLLSNTKVDFTKNNIHAIVLWALKKANLYYDQQIVDVFLELTEPQSIINYKSNKKTWSEEKWRFKKEDATHYKLDYRIIVSNYQLAMDRNCDNTWSNRSFKTNIIDDLIVIANNLGFSPCKHYDIYCDGQRRKILYANNNDVFMEYKSYKNGNSHLFIDKEFLKAFNIEASRILGWIKNFKEAKEEMDLNDTDEKYYNINYNADLCSKILLYK